MDDVSIKRDYLDRKLERETTNLDRLKKSLVNSSEQTGSMLKVLDKFQERLQKLENTILPVYKDTKTFQLRQDNIDRTLTSIDNVIGFYNIAKKSESIIKTDHVSKDLPQYMSAMVQLKSAIEYFQQHHPGSPEYSAVNTLYQRGKSSIEKEFQTLLKQHSRPLLPINIADMLGENDEYHADLGLQQPGMTSEQYMPYSVREQLQEISKWLVSNLSTTEFMIKYAHTRASVLTSSLQGLIDHQKSSSGESIVSASPSMISSFSRTKKSSKNLFSKSNRLLKKTLMRGGEISAKKEEEGFVLEMEGYVTCVSALLKLIEFENELMETIIPAKHRRRVFDIMLQPSLDLIVEEGEKLGASALKAATHYNFKEVPMLFPVVKHLRTVKPQFNEKLEGCQPVNRSKFAALITKLDNVGNDILNKFIESIKNDPDKASNMPVDGTVHELTSNTMFFMNTLKDHAEVAGAMLLVQDPMYREQNVEHLTIKVADYMTKVLSALGMNLKNKSETYHDPYLAAIFMLNNYNYIQQKLHGQNLLPMIHTYDPKVGSFYESLTEEQKKKYFESFRQIIFILSDNDRMTTQLKSSDIGKMSDKEKQAIKDKFTAFNKELEDLCRVQKAYAIPDTQLRDAIKKGNRDRIVPQYEVFRNKFLKTNFTKNAEKYIKYTSHDVSDMLDKLFDAAS